MNSVAGPSVPFRDRTSHAAMPEVSLFRLYTLRVFLLVWQRFPDGWKIVHDHTSTVVPAKQNP